MKSVLTLAVFAVLLYAGICVLLYAAQRSLLYFPTPESQHARAKALYITSGGVELKVWHVPRSAERAVLYFGGNAEDVGWNIDALSETLPSTDIYLMNYRGYGGSGGVPTEAALFADAEALFDYASARHRNVAVIGRSLGSGVAMHLADVRRVEKLVLVTPYDSVLNVAQAYLSFVPVAWLLLDHYDSLSRAARVGIPVLVLLAANDRVIARGHSERLVAAFAPAQAEVRVIDGTTHDSISLAPEYHAALAAFLLADPR